MPKRRPLFMQAFRSATSSANQSLNSSFDKEDDEKEEKQDSISELKNLGNSDVLRRDSFSSIHSATGRTDFESALAQLQSSLYSYYTTNELRSKTNMSHQGNEQHFTDHGTTSNATHNSHFHQNDNLLDSSQDSEDSMNGFVKVEHPTEFGDYGEHSFPAMQTTPSGGTSPLSPMDSHDFDHPDDRHYHDQPVHTLHRNFDHDESPNSEKAPSFGEQLKHDMHEAYEGAAQAAGGVVKAAEHAYEAATTKKYGDDDFFAGQTKQDYPYGGPDEPLVRVKREEKMEPDYSSYGTGRYTEPKHETLSPSADSGHDTVGNLLGDDSGSNSPGHRGTSPEESIYERHGKPLTFPEPTHHAPAPPTQHYQHHHSSTDSSRDALDEFLHSTTADKVLHKAADYGDDADLLLDADELPRPPASAYQHQHGFETRPRPPTPPKDESDEPRSETPPVLMLHKAERKPSLTDSRKSILKHHGSGHGPWVDFKSVDPKVLDLIYWRDPKRSGIVLALTLAALLVFAKLPLITVFSYAGLAVLAGTVAFRLFKLVEAQFKKTDASNPFKPYLEKELVVPHERVHQQVDVLIEHGQLVAQQARRLFLVEDMIDTVKFGLLLWAFTYVGSWFSGLALLILMVLAVFSVPKFYEVYKEPIDKNMAIVKEHCKKIQDTIEEKLPFLKKQKTQ